MIIVFLVILIVALIIANILVSVSRQRKRHERGFANTDIESDSSTEMSYSETPEVLTNPVDELKENNALLQGSLQATNKKLDLLNDRVSSMEKVLMNLVQKKLDDETSDETHY
jgi:flagellar basal body-associated protein FliL